jgi:predicted SnoaL-like aldol condensation-catalyzing enzyme
MGPNTQKIYKLLKGIETGDPDAARVVNEKVYVQHNPHTQEGSEGLATLFKRLSKSQPKVTMVRGFEDGDFVFAHMVYDFSSVKVAFEVFRFEHGLAVEHWDNIQPDMGTNAAGRSMLDGDVELTDLHKTEENRTLVKQFVETVLIGQKFDALDEFVDSNHFLQHSPDHLDGIEALRLKLQATSATGLNLKYQRLHRVLAQGNFVLSVSEGLLNGTHTSFYDLYRVAENKLVEHWDTIESVPPQSEWKNTNGKF